LAALLLATLAHAQSIQAILNGASYSGNLAPGTWAALFGSGLAPSTTVAQAVPLPKSLNGVSVTVGGVDAPLLFVSAGQINFIIPFEIAVPPPALNAVPVVVRNGAASSQAFNIALSPNAPAIFTRNQAGTGDALLFDGAFQPVTTLTETPMIFYAAGLGATIPPASSALGGNAAEPLNRVVDVPEVYIGDTPANVLFAGLAPGFPGIYQVNVIPKGPASGTLMIRQKGWTSNVTTAPTSPGGNVSNVVASIDGLYPATGDNVNLIGYVAQDAVMQYSTTLVAGTFTISFDILPNAKPFSVVATSEAGSNIIRFNPAAGTWTLTRTVPSLAARSFDYFGTDFKVLDFLSCTATTACSPMPGNLVPMARVYPPEFRALEYLPLPNTNTNPAGQSTQGGAIAANGHFEFRLNAAFFTAFGGFVQVPHAGGPDRTTTFRLYVDGSLVASKVASYKVRQ
jgi:uncharacterized protein (TIGR03437 family)